MKKCYLLSNNFNSNGEAFFFCLSWHYICKRYLLALLSITYLFKVLVSCYLTIYLEKEEFFEDFLIMLCNSRANLTK